MNIDDYERSFDMIDATQQRFLELLLEKPSPVNSAFMVLLTPHFQWPKHVVVLSVVLVGHYVDLLGSYAKARTLRQEIIEYCVRWTPDLLHDVMELSCRTG